MSFAGIESLMQRQQWDDAIVECRAALQLQPTHAKLYGYLGMCHYRKGEFQLAIEPFRKASVLDPNCWQAGAKLAQCYDRLHRYEEAYATAAEWLGIQPCDHTLQGLVDCLQYQVKGNKKEGWERTAYLAHDVIIVNHDER